MWETVKHVTSSFTLAAFIAATVGIVARFCVDRWFAMRTRLVELATDARRQELVATGLEKFHVDTTGLTKDQKYKLLLEQLRERRRRLRLLTVAVSSVIGLVVVGLLVSSMLDNRESVNPNNLGHGPARSIDNSSAFLPAPKSDVKSGSDASVSSGHSTHEVDVGVVNVGDRSSVTIGNVHGESPVDVGVGRVSAGSGANISIGNKRN